MRSLTRSYQIIEVQPRPGDIPKRYEPGRRCKDCDKPQSTYNPHPRCFACQSRFERSQSHDVFLGWKKRR